jgi:hypothetical protein
MVSWANCRTDTLSPALRDAARERHFTLAGAWLVYRASRTADADAGRTIAEFIADHTREEPPQAEPPAQL